MFTSCSSCFSGRLRTDPHAPAFQHAKNPTDISLVPDDLAAYPGDALEQSAILTEIIGTRIRERSFEERFNNMPQNRLKLSALRSLYNARDKRAVNLLSTRHTVQIDEEFKVPLGTGQAKINTDQSMIDYRLTVANSIGFSALLPNAVSSINFCFTMDLQRPYTSFKGKHATLGFDPAGSMLYIGRRNDEDVFLAMAPDAFLRGETEPCPAGFTSGSPVMSKRHYRQMVMMLAHFLECIPHLAFANTFSVYEQDLESSKPNFERITNILYVFCLSVDALSSDRRHSFRVLPSLTFRFSTARSRHAMGRRGSTLRTSDLWTRRSWTVTTAGWKTPPTIGRWTDFCNGDRP
jgi:hypothetical protein